MCDHSKLSKPGEAVSSPPFFKPKFNARTNSSASMENATSKHALTQLCLIASTNPPQNPNKSMLCNTRKRGQATSDDGDCDATLLDALGLGSFARLDLPAPTVVIDLVATMDLAMDNITVSLGGACVTASPTDLAAALALPLGPIPLASEVDVSVFSSAEAIATVRGFVHDRLLLGGGEDVGSLPKEALTALRLVEEGKAYAVDWGRLVWAALHKEVLIGKPQRYTQYLLQLMKCQKCELFSRGDETLSLGKRRKNLTLQQCQGTDDGINVGVENKADDQRLGTKAEVEEGLFSRLSENIDDSLIHDENIDDQCWAAEASVEEGLVFGVSQNGQYFVHGHGDNTYYRCNATEAVTGDRLVSAVSHNMGELETMPFVGNIKEVSGVVSLESKRTTVEEGVHGINKRNAENGDGSVVVNYQSSDNSSFQALLSRMEARSHLPSSDIAIFETKPHFLPYKQPINEIEDEEEDGTRNVDVGPIPPATRTAPFGHMPGQSFMSFNTCLQQIVASVPNMEGAFLDMGKTLAATQAEVQHMREALKEKDDMIKSTIKDIQEELQARSIKIYQLEQDKEAMRCTFQECKQLFKISSAAFQEYKNMRRREGVESATDVITMVDMPNQISGIHLQPAYHMINEFQKRWFARSSACVDKITQMATKMADLNNEVQNLKNSRSIPNHNKDKPRL